MEKIFGFEFNRYKLVPLEEIFDYEFVDGETDLYFSYKIYDADGFKYRYGIEIEELKEAITDKVIYRVIILPEISLFDDYCKKSIINDCGAECESDIDSLDMHWLGLYRVLGCVSYDREGENKDFRAECIANIVDKIDEKYKSTIINELKILK